MRARDFNVLAAIHGLQDRGFIIVSPVEQRAGYRLVAPGELDADTLERCVKELNKLPWFEDVVSLVDVEATLRALEAQESEG